MLENPVNSYGHGRMVSSSNHTFSWASLTKQLTSTSCTYFCLKLTTTFLESAGREENGRRTYFMINLHESMGLGRDQICCPWIISHTSICSETCYRLRLEARFSEINDPLLGCWNVQISAILNQHSALMVQFNPQGSYRQVSVKFKDFSRTSKTFLPFSRTGNLWKILIYTLKFYFWSSRVHY